MHASQHSWEKGNIGLKKLWVGICNNLEMKQVIPNIKKKKKQSRMKLENILTQMLMKM